MRRSTAAAAVMLWALLGTARAAPTEQRVVLSEQPGMTLSMLYHPVPNPVASVILFVGGDGDLAHEANSFLLRVRERFVAAGMSVAVPDTPSDHPGGFGPLFRTWSAHTQDIASIVTYLKRQSPAPIWAVGTSNGTISAAIAAANLGPRNIAGVVLTSSVWLGGLGQVPVEKIAVPVLIVHDRDDRCPAARFDLEAKNLPRLEAAPEKTLIAVTGGGNGGPRCGTGSPHDFWGVEDEVVPPIIAFIKSHRRAGPLSARVALPQLVK
jgi:dienelactone hydrolase